MGLITPHHVQAILVDCEVIGDDFHMLMGTYSKSGERIVFDYSFWKDTKLEIAIRKSGLANFSGDVPRVFPLNQEETDKFFSEHLSEPITIGTVTKIASSDGIESIRSVIESYGFSFDKFKLNWEKMGSSESLKYYSDLEKIVNVVPDDLRDRGPIEGENTVIIFDDSTAVTIDNIDRLTDGVSVGVLIFETRVP